MGFSLSPLVKRLLVGSAVVGVVAMAGPGLAAARAEDEIMQPMSTGVTLASISAQIVVLNSRQVSIQSTLGTTLEATRSAALRAQEARNNSSSVMTQMTTAQAGIDYIQAQAVALETRLVGVGTNVSTTLDATRSAAARAVEARDNASTAITRANEARLAALDAVAMAENARNVGNTTLEATRSAAARAVEARDNAGAANTTAEAARVRVGEAIARAVEARDNSAEAIVSAREARDWAQTNAQGISAVRATLEGLEDEFDTVHARQAAIESMVSAVANDLAIGFQAMQTAITAAGESGADLSPLAEAWGSAECGAVRDVPWWSLTTNTAPPVWTLDESHCGVQRGDIRDAGERVAEGMRQARDSQSVQDASEHDALMEALGDLSELLAEKIQDVSDGIGEGLADVVDSVSAGVTQAARTADSMEALLGLAEFAGIGAIGVPIPGENSDVLEEAKDATEQKLNSYFEPFQCIADVAGSASTGTTCGGGPALSIPLPGLDPIEWRPFEWCGDDPGFVMAREAAGFSLIVLASLGWIWSIVRGLGYAAGSGPAVNVAAQALGHEAKGGK